MVETDIQILTTEQREQLQKSYLFGQFHGKAAVISDKTLEPDGRRRNRVIKEAVNAGFLKPNGADSWHGNAYEITSDVMSIVVPELPNLLDHWTKFHDSNSHREAYERPWIRIEDLSIGGQFAVLQSRAFEWFVVSDVPYRYHARFADERATILTDGSESQAYDRYWNGPLATLEEAVAVRKSSTGTCLAVSSNALRIAVTQHYAERKLQGTFANNLLWGLVALDVIPKDTVFDTDGKPTIDAQLVEGHSLRFSSDPNPPANRDAVNWESNIANSIERLKSRIAKAEEQLNTLRLIDSGVVSFGGWGPFMDALEMRLRQAVK